MDEHPNATMFRRAIDAMGSGDLDGFMAAFTDDAVWHAPGMSPFSGRFEGKEAIVERFGRLREAGARTRMELHDVLGNDEHVVALLSMHLETPHGAYHEPHVNVMHLRDGKIAELWAMNQDQAVVDWLLRG